MANVKLNNVRILGVGHLGIAVASHFNGDTLTSGLDYGTDSVENFKVDNILQVKEFDGGFGKKMDDVLTRERNVVLENFSGTLIFLVAQTEGRFQEAIIPPLLKLLRSTGAFVGFFPIIPIGADRKREMEKVQKMKGDLDAVELLDSENILSEAKNQRIMDINTQYHNRIWQKVISIAKVVDNSTALGISLHDIKMQTGLYGPVQILSFSYPFVNFSIAERDVFDAIDRMPREKIKRMYMVLELGNEVDSRDVITFVRKVKNRMGSIDFRQGFIHTREDFGVIVLNFGSF
jgi:hypothetical protein